MNPYKLILDLFWAKIDKNYLIKILSQLGETRETSKTQVKQHSNHNMPKTKGKGKYNPTELARYGIPSNGGPIMSITAKKSAPELQTTDIGHISPMIMYKVPSAPQTYSKFTKSDAKNSIQGLFNSVKSAEPYYPDDFKSDTMTMAIDDLNKLLACVEDMKSNDNDSKLFFYTIVRNEVPSIRKVICKAFPIMAKDLKL